MLRSRDECFFHAVLVRIVVASDEADGSFLFRDERGQDARAVRGAEVAHVDEHDVAGHFGLRKERGDEIALAGIIRRHFEQSAAEFDAVSDEEIESVVRVAARDLVHLRDADIFRIGGLEAVSRLKVLQPVVCELAPAAVGNHSREEQRYACLPAPVRPRFGNR